MAHEFEHTDTFGGEANYCWVSRETLSGEFSDRQLIRRAKAFAGFTGLRCRVENYGDMIRITPTGRHAPCQTVFVNWLDDPLPEPVPVVVAGAGDVA